MRGFSLLLQREQPVRVQGWHEGCVSSSLLLKRERSVRVQGRQKRCVRLLSTDSERVVSKGSGMAVEQCLGPTSTALNGVVCLGPRKAVEG